MFDLSLDRFSPKDIMSDMTYEAPTLNGPSLTFELSRPSQWRD